jgi:hypothetical protein
MPRAFDITATTSSVRLDASGLGEVSFTVTNALRQAVSVRASVEPVGNARAEWMSFPDGMERVLSPDGTAVIPVRIAAPTGTPPGSYSFSLVVASISNPDEHYDRGPTVAFTVAEATAPVKKPFPWWIVALAAGVLIIGGGVVAILASRGGEAPGLGLACAKEEPRCGADLTCGEGNVCLGNAGFKGCERGEQCATSRCEEGTCQERVALEGACNSAEDCAAPLACHEGTCRGSAGFQGCERPEQCVPGRCEGGSCQEKVTLGDSCDSADDCRSPLTCHQGFCLMPVGEKCNHPSQCVSGNCVGNQCQPQPGACPAPCPLGFVCIEGRCQRRFILRDQSILRELEVQPQRTVPNP